MKKFPGKLKHLRKAVTMTSPTGNGMCFHRAAAMVLDLPGSNLVFGVFRAATEEEKIAMPGSSDVPFIHAWVEWGGKAFAPSAIERTGGLVAMPIDGYRSVNGAHTIKVLTRPQLLRIARETGLVAHIMKDAELKGSFIGMMLHEVGMPFLISPDGGVIPSTKSEESEHE